ncbi:hypothetical protein Q3G72_019848 [Acer saccharum]|nr:hypothetical protein Q3G72_019848 [Acer saccharum]
MHRQMCSWFRRRRVCQNQTHRCRVSTGSIIQDPEQDQETGRPNPRKTKKRPPKPDDKKPKELQPPLTTAVFEGGAPLPRLHREDSQACLQIQSGQTEGFGNLPLSLSLSLSKTIIVNVQNLYASAAVQSNRNAKTIVFYYHYHTSTTVDHLYRGLLLPSSPSQWRERAEITIVKGVGELVWAWGSELLEDSSSANNKHCVLRITAKSFRTEMTSALGDLTMEVSGTTLPCIIVQKYRPSISPSICRDNVVNRQPSEAR